MTIAAGASSGVYRQRGFWLRCFLERAWPALAILLFLGASALRAQDCIDAHGNPCSAKNTGRLRAAMCKTEVVSPNFFVAAPTTVSGLLFDQTDAPFSIGANTIIQVRDTNTGKPLYTAPVNLRGRFDLGVVKAGTFRFIVAVKVHGGVLERPPGFDQPPRIDCSNESECNLRVTLHTHGSDDDPLASCPPK